MLSGVPTILILDIGVFNLLNSKFRNLINKLLKSKILFYNSNEAAKHINKIIDNPSKWYNSNDVKKTRMEYLKLAFGLNK